MFVIVSGCDRTGKTTLCTNLVNRLNGQYVHFSVPKSKEAAFQEYMDFIKSADSNQLYIIDRFYECENIYAPIFRGYQQNNCNELDNLIRTLQKTLFIYVTADIEIINARVINDGDDYVNLNETEKIVANYEQYIQHIRLPYIILKNNMPEDLTNNIETSINIINLIKDQLTDDIFGNLHGTKAIILLNNSLNKINDQLFKSRFLIEGSLKYENYSFYEENDEFKWNVNKIIDFNQYTDYVYTNNETNVNLLNIDERLYISKI